MAKERRHILYSGTVQGVGFRYTASRLAKYHDLTGYVGNLPDGRVELLVEGESPDIDSFLNELDERMGPYIEDAKVTVSDYTGQYNTFGVRY